MYGKDSVIIFMNDVEVWPHLLTPVAHKGMCGQVVTPHEQNSSTGSNSVRVMV